MFRTEVHPIPPEKLIRPEEKLIHIGSCFSEHIGNKFVNQGFQCIVNPFGQQYNPFSIAQAIDRLISINIYKETDLIFYEDQYHSFDHHSQFSGMNKVDVLKSINQQYIMASDFLKTTDRIFITFGTAHYYTWNETHQIVSNCHKIPAGKFELHLPKVEYIITRFSETLNRLYTYNPNIEVVFTISPVRYPALGMHHNTLSKSLLFSAIQQLQESFPAIYYFPSYELVIDDLRDYRFYNSDMIHPNEQAVLYVWDKLKSSMCSKECQTFIHSVESIQKACQHRPRNIYGEAHHKFLQSINKQIEHLETLYPFVMMDSYKKQLLTQLELIEDNAAQGR